MGNRKVHSSEEIIRKLRQAEVLLHGGKSVAEACRELGVCERLALYSRSLGFLSMRGYCQIPRVLSQ